MLLINNDNNDTAGELEQRTPIERVLDIPELWSTILAYLHPKQLRRLRLVSRRLYLACTPHIHVSLILTSQKHVEVAWDQDFPSKLVSSLRIVSIDQFSPALTHLLNECTNITSLDINVFGLDVDFLQELLDYCPQHLKSLVIRSEGFVSLESIVETFLQSTTVGRQIQSLALDIGSTGLFETDALSWTIFRSLLDSCTSLTSLFLSAVKVMDIPESLEEINPLHATKAMFPNLVSLTMTLCDISSVGRIRLLKMFPNLHTLDMTCRDDVFQADSGESATNSVVALEMTTQDLCEQLTHVRVNSRSQSEQEGLFRFLGHLRHLERLELSGLATQGARLLDLAEEWSRNKVSLKQLTLSPKYRKLTEEGLEKVLLKPCFSRLLVLDAWCGPDLILRFWNRETQRSQLPFLDTLRALHLRKEDVVSDLDDGAMEALNMTLKQLPRLVDLTVGTKLEDFGVFQGMGRDPEVLLPDPRTVMYTGPEAVDWSDERPFLQTLVIGCSTEFFTHRMGDIPRQVGKRFRFLEDFKFT
ncbi:hypothetical protein BG015_010089 [Linnemannia schmuckeri]|uniref:F-box domain-containing protein n=1 Tax=Linnemannia schmuckeri TaxID=64567 RepID=A0A9P5RV05_9FUNG|nr:hypothetical protein BG015_010089 [Linnemannia schmuckeri]